MYGKLTLTNHDYMIDVPDGDVRRIIAHCPTEADRDFILARLQFHDRLERLSRERGLLLQSLPVLIRVARSLYAAPPSALAYTHIKPGIHVGHMSPNGAMSVTAKHGVELTVMPSDFEYLTPHEIKAILRFFARDDANDGT